jgi:tetrahydromethanopterin S-methyltransferase subunit F
MAEEESKAAGPIRMVAIENMVENIRYKAQILARTNKLDSGIMDSGIVGFSAGLIIVLLLIVVPVVVM